VQVRVQGAVQPPAAVCCLNLSLIVQISSRYDDFPPTPACIQTS
jgi:hypothetical protein